MLIEISKIRVNDRIRRDYGDLEELASNIRENTLMNPPVVMPNGDGTYTLIAGERRLRAMRDILGYKQTEANVVSPRDAEQALHMEISENECRKDFSMTERLAYADKLQAIKTAEAKVRMVEAHTTGVPNSAHLGKTRDAVAGSVGMGHETLRQARIVNNSRDLLDPADFELWDEGKLSTNKVFQKVKAAQAQAERDKLIAEKERDAAREDLEDAYRTSEALEDEVASLKRQIATKPEPEVVEREVVKEVVPDDYEAIKRRVHDLEHIERIHREDNQGLRKQLADRTDELEKARDILKINENVRDIRRDVTYLVQATNSYVRQYGGLTWTLQQLSEVDEPTLEQLRKAARNLATFASALVSNLETIEGS